MLKKYPTVVLCFSVKFNLILSALFLLISSTYAQKNTSYYTFQRYQTYLQYLITSGKVSQRFPLSQPYRVNELHDSIQHNDCDNSFLFNQLKTDLIKRNTNRPDTLNKGLLMAESEASYTLEQVNNTTNHFGKINPALTYNIKDITLRYEYTLDEKYKLDSNYFGTTGKLESENFGRATEAYLDIYGKRINFFAGRILRNFGVPGENGLHLSENAYSFDHIALAFTSNIFQYTAIFSRLNDIYGYDIRDSMELYSWNTRFLSIHRFELSLSNTVHFAITESMLFGGKDKFPQLLYINPANVFFFSKMSDRKGYEERKANSMISFEGFWALSKKFSFFGQFLLDDMDFTKRLRKIYPDRIGYMAKLFYNDPFPSSQVSLTYNRISNWTYNSFYTWGNYTFYNKSLGYPENGIENLRLQFDMFNLKPFILSYKIQLERSRNQNLEAAFIAIKSGFPYDNYQKSFTTAVNIAWLPRSFMNINLCTEYMNTFKIDDPQNTKSYFNIIASVQLYGVYKLLKK
jgi:hypothetical protein